MVTQMREVLPVMRDLFLPSIYDALFLIRPSLNFRDGTVVKNCMVDFTQYLTELPFNHSYLFALIHLIPADYKSTLDTSVWQTSLLEAGVQVAPGRTNPPSILGFASLFLLVKSYGNGVGSESPQSIPCEVSQLCYGGVLRAVALGSTDGICTWRCSAIVMFQGLIVPVGRITLGRIFNVVGSCVDAYIELSLSSQFNTAIPVAFCSGTN
jgi:hypothetical protein